jgi:anti-anti-sigma factor
MADSRLFFSLRNSDGYSVIAFPSELSTAHMAEVREAGDRIVNELNAARCPACLVDLTALNYMGSALVASVVRIWKTVKAQDGRMVVVVSNPQVTEVLKVAKLTKVWTIAHTFEAGVHLLGYSEKAKTVRRQGQVLTFLAPLLLLVALYGMGSQASDKLGAIYRMPTGLVYGLASAAFLAGLISWIREADRSWRRPASVTVAVLSLLVVVGTWWVTGRGNAETPAPEGSPAGETPGATSSQAEQTPGAEQPAASVAAPAGTPVDAADPQSAATRPAAAADLPAQAAPVVRTTEAAVPPSPSETPGQGNASEQ